MSRQSPSTRRSDMVVAGWAALAGLIVGTLLTLGAALAWPGLAGPNVVFVLGCLVLAVAHALSTSLLMLALPEHRKRLGLRGEPILLYGHRGTGVTLGAILAVAVLALDIWLWRVHLATGTEWALTGASVLGVFAIFVPPVTCDHCARRGSRRAKRAARWFVTSPVWHALSIGLVAGLQFEIIGVLVVVLAVAGSSLRRQDALPTSKVMPMKVNASFGQYVALGDSYSAGEGLGDFTKHSITNGCHLSRNESFPDLVDKELKPQPRFTRLACSGAVTNDLAHARRLTPPIPAVPAQLNGKHSHVGLVTMTIGGNDIFFSSIVSACFELGNCTHDRFVPPLRTDVGTPPMPGPLPLDSWARAAVAVLAQRLHVLFPLVKADYWPARIVVVGYPYLFPRGHPGSFLDDCTSLLRRYSRRERSWLDDQVDDLNNMIYAEAAAAGLEFVSPVDAWGDHEPCTAEAPYTNSIKPFLSFEHPIDGGSFHPTKLGQEALAALVETYLNQHPRQPNPYINGHSSGADASSGGGYCPSQLGLLPPPGEQIERCPTD